MYPTIQGQPVGYQQLTSISAATPLTLPSGGAVSALIVASVQAVRFRADGTDPTANVGMLLPVNTPLQWYGNLALLKFILVTSGAILDVMYFR